MDKIAVGSRSFEIIGFGAFFVLYSLALSITSGNDTTLLSDILCKFETQYHLFPNAMKILSPAIAIGALFISYAFGAVIFFSGSLSMKISGKLGCSWQTKREECLKQHLEIDAQNKSNYYLRQLRKIEAAEAVFGLSLLILFLQPFTGFSLETTLFFLGWAIASIYAVKIFSDETHDLLCNSEK